MDRKAGHQPSVIAEEEKVLFRVHVSSLDKGRIHRQANGIKEEHDLSTFFQQHGCNVCEVRLVIDTKSSKSRGFGFVDFDDAESLSRALGLDGERMGEADVNLKIKVARTASDDAAQQERELASAKNETDDLQREVALREARVNQLLREVDRKRERQVVESVDPTHELETERKKQQELQRELQTLREIEAAVIPAHRFEEERTRALEDIMSSVDQAQTRMHTQEQVEEVISPTGSHKGALQKCAEAIDLSPADALHLRVRNTFLEFYTPPVPDVEPLKRGQSAPVIAENQWRRAMNTDAGDGEVNEKEAVAASTAQRPRRLPASGLQQQLREQGADPAAQVSRGLLEDKMFIPGASQPSASRLWLASALPANKSIMEDPKERCLSGVSEGATPDSPRRRRVRFLNVPVQPVEQTRVLVQEELGRLWKVARALPAPEVEEIEVPEKEGERTWSEVAAGTEVVIQFASHEDAVWLVEGRHTTAWYHALDLSIGGRVLRIQWAEPGPSFDWRRLRHQADTDASSLVSYDTVGTRHSILAIPGSSNGHAEASASETQGLAGAGRRESARVNSNPPRTIVLEGLRKEWPAHLVEDEVLKTLKAMWSRHGYAFNPQADLHRKGAEGGIVVRRGRAAGSENDGTCLVKLRRHMDAKWLVEGCVGKLVVGGGTNLKAFWARPRNG